MDFRSVDFINDPTEDHLLAVSGTDGFKANLRIVNSRDHIVSNYFLDDGKFT
jgi:hypothetical protein